MGWVFIVVAMVMGVLLAIQAGSNTALQHWVGDPMRAAFVSIVASLALISSLLVVSTLIERKPWPTAAKLGQAPWWVWIGGFLGATYVTATIFFLPRLGATLWLAAVVVGEMLAGLVLDNFGLLGLRQHAVTPVRLLGALLLIGGVVLIRRN